MEKNNLTISKAVPFNAENIDTDQIIPARFLKAVKRGDFGKNLFRDLCYQSGTDTPIADFCLNKYPGDRKILVAGNNIGCGSSREHAVWALYDYGFRVVVSTSFADIFKNNSFNNGLLPLTVSKEYLNELMKTITENPDVEIRVSVEEQTITNPITGNVFNFQIESFRRECLLKGFDNTSYLLSMKDDIVNFEKQHTK